MMTLEYKRSESAIKPSEIEICKNTVYIRKNITLEERTDNDATFDFWVYQEATLSLSEFEEYSKLASVKNMDGNDNLLTIMEAIADLYDVIANLAEGGLS